MLARSLAALCLLAVVTAALAVTTARASGPPLPPGSLDLSLESRVSVGLQDLWGLTIRNNPVAGTGRVARDVKVLITPRPVAADDCEVACAVFGFPFRVSGFSTGEPSRYDPDTGVWTIPRLEPTDHASIMFYPHHFERLDFEIQNPQTDVLQYSRLRASILDAEVHGDAALFNNAVEDAYFWQDSTTPRATLGNAGTDVVLLESGDLGIDDVATFSVRAMNKLVEPPEGWTINGVPVVNDIESQYDVRVEIELSPGLAFAPGALPPGDSERPAVARVWVPVSESGRGRGPSVPPGTSLPGTVHASISAWPILNVPVTITSTPSLEDLPLERRCLTARVVSAQPAFEDPRRQFNDVSTACLRFPPPTVLTAGEIDLWWVHDCVGVTAHPCTATDEIKVLARAARSLISLPAINAVGTVNLGYKDEKDIYLDPESVIVQVRDPHGRDYDDRTRSLTDGNTVSWHTGRSAYSGVPDVFVKSSDQHLEASGQYPGNSLVYTVTITGLDGADAPGNARVRVDGAQGYVHYDPHLCESLPSSHSCSTPTHSTNPLRPWSGTFDYFLEFDDLGTYIVNFGVAATHSNGTTYDADGDYTFHVGPISELEVRDARVGSPLAAADETAYTIVAANNGPDTAPAVAVTLTGVPQGAEVIASEGGYAEGACDAAGLCAGTWTLGEFQTSERRAFEGKLASPTLTLIPPASVAAPNTITASIRNTQPYTVVIDGTVHSTDYFDYIDRNNTDAIEARPGTGEGAPGQPRTPRVLQSTDPRVAIVSWERVERFNDWPVEKYEVHRSALPCERPSPDPPMSSISVVRGELFLDESLNEDVCYAVRAVNDRGGKGYWSRLASTRGGATLGGLDASKREISVAENYGQDTYTIVLDGQPSNDVRVRITSTDDDIAFVRPGEIVFTTTNWDVPRTITVVGQPDNVDNPNDRRTAVIQHALSGGGADGAVTPAVQVTVIDDDGARKATISKSSLSLAEASGADSYTVSLSAPPTSAVDLTITASNGAVAVAPTSHRFEVGEQHKTITVTAVDDAVDNASDRTASISHTLSGGGYGGVTVPNVSVTVLDDDDAEDAPSISKSEDSLTVSEAGGTKSYTVSLSSEPTGIVLVSMTVSGDTGAVRVAPPALTFTPQDWSQPKTVTVVGQDDRTVGTRRATITHSVAGGGYSGVTLGDVTIIVSDNDEAGITLSTRSISLEEAPGQSPRERATYEISLSSRPTSDVTVKIETDPMGVVRMKSEVTFKPNEWNIPKPVTVIVIDDGLDNPGDERTATITHTASGGGFDGVSAEIAVTVADDDESGLRLGVCAGGEYGNQHCHPGNVTWVEPGGTIEWSRSGANGRFGGNDDRRGAEDPPGTGYPKDVYFCVDLGSAPASRVSFHVKSSDHDVARPIFSTIVQKYPDRYQCQSNPLTALRPGGLAPGANPNLAIAFPEAGDEATITLEILTSRAGDGGTYSRGYTETFTFRVVE